MFRSCIAALSNVPPVSTHRCEAPSIDQSQSAHPMRLAFYRTQLFYAGTAHGRVVSPPSTQAEDIGARHDVEPPSCHGFKHSTGHSLAKAVVRPDRSDRSGQTPGRTVRPPLRCSLGSAALTLSTMDTPTPLGADLIGSHPFLKHHERNIAIAAILIWMLSIVQAVALSHA